MSPSLHAAVRAMLNEPVYTTMTEVVSRSWVRQGASSREHQRNANPILDKFLTQYESAVAYLPRFREIYTGPEYIGQTPDATGQPNPEEQQRCAEAACRWQQKGGKSADAAAARRRAASCRANSSHLALRLKGRPRRHSHTSA